jgi:predicted TIM-barrel fold metal-dependent hydrolase
MKKTLTVLAFWTFIGFTFPVLLEAQTTPDPALVAAIAAIKAIDNHAHPLRALKEGERDTEWGALSYHTLETAATDPGAEMPLVPFRLRPTSPEFMAVWQALYGFSPSTVTKEVVQELVQVKRRIRSEQADNYPAWVLDKIGLEAMLANRVVMDRSLPVPRFRWVPYVDALMFPLSNEAVRQARPDLVTSYGSLERLLKTHLTDLGLNRLPPSLEGYLTGVVTPTLERQKQGGAVAFKFLTAYVRKLDISNPSVDQVQRVYARYIEGGKPTAGEYQALQDYLFRFISREAGRLDLPVHIHTGFGIGRYFDVVDSNPLLLEPIFNEPLLRNTKFVMIHGGWPFTEQSAALLLKPNVYVDFSARAFLLYPRELSQALRRWLEISPDKVLFGTDGFELDPDMPFLNWEEFTCLGTRSTRQALALTLTEMMQDNEISYEEALSIARKVLRENAVKLYKLETP